LLNKQLCVYLTLSNADLVSRIRDVSKRLKMSIVDYKIIGEYKLVVHKASGIIGVDDFISMLKQLYSLDEYVGTTYILTDIRDVKVDYKMSDIEDIALFVKDSSVNPTMVYHAILTDGPSLVAMSLLFQHATRGIPDYQCMVFGTVNGAAGYLHLPECVLSDAILALS